MIFAAGLGMRLMPLTQSKPKALVEIKNKTLLEIAINRLIRYGFDDIIVNVHHFSEQVKTFVSNNEFDASITISDETDLLLDTGGGLLKAKWFFNDQQPFLVHNVDIISQTNLSDLYQTHLQSNAIATLCVQQRNTSRYLLFNTQNELSGRIDIKNNIKIITREAIDTLQHLAFSGIQVINPSIFEYMIENGKFSISDLYCRLSKNHSIKAYMDANSEWIDVGKPESIATANQLSWI